MTSATGLRLHNVQSIAVTSHNADGSNWMDFTFIDESGGRHVVTAFVKQPVAIEGAEFVNFIAAAPEPA